MKSWKDKERINRRNAQTETNTIIQLSYNHKIAIQKYNCHTIIRLSYNHTFAIQSYICHTITQIQKDNKTITDEQKKIKSL